MIKGGYNGKILRIDLSEGKTSSEPLPDETVLRKYVGNLGLGLWYLMKELPNGIDPLEPENPLIFMNGPLIGTRTPSPTNCTITTLNADTKFTAGRAHSHGWFGPYLGKAGWDGIIVTGASDKWVYLWIDDDKVEIRDAEKFLGKDTHEMEEVVKEDLGINKKLGAADGASVASIGPAGENLVAGATIMNDRNHGFCHSGVGQVMGSKKLKAIAVRGTGDIKVGDPEKLRSISKEWNKHAGKEGLYPIVGQGSHMKVDYEGVLELVGVSANNWLRNELPGFGKGWKNQKIQPRPCFRCPVACCYDIEMLEGRWKGYVASLSGGGENIEGAAAIMGAGASGDPGEALYLTDLFDRLGLETSTVGCAMAVAFEAYEKGLLTKEDTEGLELTWGNTDAIIELMRRYANKEGTFVKMLTEGPKVAAQRLGIPDAAVEVKGSGINLHDWRRAWGELLVQFISSGSGWHSLAADIWCPEADVGYPEKVGPLDPRQKGEQVARVTRLKFWEDCFGTCVFATWGIPGVLKFTTGALGAVVGWDDFSPEEALAVGHRVVTLERIINMRYGLTPEDDINVSPRMIEPAPADAGPAAGMSPAPYIEGWVRDYYEELGWHRRTGKPLRSTMQKLGLDEFIDLVWGRG
ncbi:MAG: hypothetical protein ISS61_01750 [Desulfobacteraceae bacterium]|nr:hypothetical protein [Desulfobacteraceae bacterium]